MPRTINRLTPLSIKSLKKPGRYADGNRLYLRIAPGGSKQWVLVYRTDGRWREMGLGGLDDVSLKQARELADGHRFSLSQGGDPIAERRAARSKVPTFGDLADEIVASLSAGFRNDKHIAQWKSTLRTYAGPLRSLSVDAITTEDVLRVLRPIWVEKRETASRLRGRIEKILDGATAKGYRRDANPARWKGHLETLLPKQEKVARGHHAAMPFALVPDFLDRIGKVSGTSARALEFTILTAARTGETLGAVWSEFDIDTKVWTIPASRMKAGREHRVPLSDRVVEILGHLRAEGEFGADNFVFAGARPGKALSNMALAMSLRRLEIKPEPTVHGFRSSFRDWAGEATSFPREVAEASLAHVVGDATERAYRRGDALEKRRALMEAWSDYCLGRRADVVVPLHAASR